VLRPPLSRVDRSRDLERRGRSLSRSRLRDLDRDLGLHDLLLVRSDFLVRESVVAEEAGTATEGGTGTLDVGGMTKFWPLVTPVLAGSVVDSDLADGGSGFDCRYDLVSKVMNSLSTNPFVSCCKNTSS
jgi:hypothetical protein